MKRGREGHDPQSGPSRLPVGAKPSGGDGRGRLPVDRGSVPAGSDFILTAAGSRITDGQADVGGGPVTLALPSRPGIAVSSRWRRLRARSMTAPRPDASRWPDTSLPPSGHGRSPPTHRRSAGAVNGSEPAASARRCGSTVSVATGIAIPHRRASGRAGILLGHPDALPERRRHRMVQDPRSARVPCPQPPRCGGSPYRSRPDGPEQPRRERVAVDRLVATRLRGSHEALGPVHAERAAQAGAAELGPEATLLCSFTRRSDARATRTIHSRSSSANSISGSGKWSLRGLETVLCTASISPPDSAPPQNTRFCSIGRRLVSRSSVRYSVFRRSRTLIPADDER